MTFWEFDDPRLLAKVIPMERIAEAYEHYGYPFQTEVTDRTVAYGNVPLLFRPNLAQGRRHWIVTYPGTAEAPEQLAGSLTVMVEEGFDVVAVLDVAGLELPELEFITFRRIP